MFGFPSVAVEDCSITSSSTPIVLSPLNAVPNPLSEGVKDCSSTSSSTPIIFPLDAISSSSIEEVEASSNTDYVCSFNGDQHEIAHQQEDVAGTIKDRKHIRCIDKTCPNTYVSQRGMKRHAQKHHGELIKPRSKRLGRIRCIDKTCNKKYSRSDHMKSHARKVHPDITLRKL